jgi:hypothetical protein
MADISIFCSPKANCLEKRGRGFHYSVIGGNATILLAPGYVGGHPLNDESPASISEGLLPVRLHRRR